LEFNEKKEQGNLDEYLTNLPKWEELEERQREAKRAPSRQWAEFISMTCLGDR